MNSHSWCCVLQVPDKMDGKIPPDAMDGIAMKVDGQYDAPKPQRQPKVRIYTYLIPGNL